MGFRGTGTLRDVVTPWRVVGTLGLPGLVALIVWNRPGGTFRTVVWVVLYVAFIEIVPKLDRPGYRLRWGELFNLSGPKSSAAIAARRRTSPTRRGQALR
jgi:hypothetical protein